MFKVEKTTRPSQVVPFAYLKEEIVVANPTTPEPARATTDLTIIIIGEVIEEAKSYLESMDYNKNHEGYHYKTLSSLGEDPI